MYRPYNVSKQERQAFRLPGDKPKKRVRPPSPPPPRVRVWRAEDEVKRPDFFAEQVRKAERELGLR